MINRYSIFFNITLVVVISIISLTILFFVLIETDNDNYIKEMRKRTFWVLALHRHVNILAPNEDIESILKDANFILISDSTKKNQVINNGESIFKRDARPSFPFKRLNHSKKYNRFKGDRNSRHFRRNRDSRHDEKESYRDRKIKVPHPKQYEIIKYNDNYFSNIVFQNNETILLEYIQTDSNSILYTLLIAGVTLILVLAYITILKSIYPIKKLQEKVKQFGEGDLDIHCQASKKDEISNLANEFHNAIQKIKSLTESRTLFLRNLMHEFHTPITKGKISVELLDESRDKSILYNVFQRLELLMEELTQIEKLTSRSYELKFKECRIIDIIDQATDRLFLDPKQVLIEVNNDNLKVDFELFSIAIKNLIDNGIKYSNNQVVHIIHDRASLKFISRGEQLQYPLEAYLKPFYKGDDVKPGLGLGLYIVHHILTVHQFKLSYQYENDNNIFVIEPIE